MITNINLHTAQLNKITSVTQTNRVNPASTPSLQNDSVSISDSAKLIMQSIQDTGTPVDVSKVSQLQMLITSGSYHIDSDKIAQKLVRDATEL